MSLYGIEYTVDEAKIPYFKNCWTRVPSEHGNLSMKKTIQVIRSRVAPSFASLKQKKAQSSIRGTLKTGSSGT